MRLTATIFAVLFAFQANAQENKVSVSGRAWASVENVQMTGATNPANNVRERFRVTNDASWIRIRGDLKLSDTLTAWGQIESQFAIDGAPSTANFVFDSGRNTGVGFTSKVFGTITAGRWDSPMKLSTIRLDPWGNSTMNNYAAIVGSFGAAGTLTAGNVYDSRLGNAVQYWTPVIQGLQARIAAMTNEDRNNTFSPNVFSGSVTYDGPVYLAAAYETRRNCSGANTQATPICAGPLLAAAGPTRFGRDWSLRLGAGFNYKPTHTELGVVYDRLESKATTAATGVDVDLKRDGYYGSLVQGLGGDAHQIVAAVGVAAKTKGNFLPTNDKTGALFWTAAYRYNFNKDLFVYAAYVRIDNDDNATYRFATGGIASAGAAHQGWSVGARYLF